MHVVFTHYQLPSMEFNTYCLVHIKLRDFLRGICSQRSLECIISSRLFFVNRRCTWTETHRVHFNSFALAFSFNEIQIGRFRFKTTKHFILIFDWFKVISTIWIRLFMIWWKVKDVKFLYKNPKSCWFQYQTVCRHDPVTTIRFKLEMRWFKTAVSFFLVAFPFFGDGSFPWNSVKKWLEKKLRFLKTLSCCESLMPSHDSMKSHQKWFGAIK